MKIGIECRAFQIIQITTSVRRIGVDLQPAWTPLEHSCHSVDIRRLVRGRRLTALLGMAAPWLLSLAANAAPIKKEVAPKYEGPPSEVFVKEPEPGNELTPIEGVELSQGPTGPGRGGVNRPIDELVSVLVYMDPREDPGPRVAATAPSCRAAVKGYSGLCGAVVQHEYDILPNVVNVRDLPRGEIPVLENLPGVLKIEEDQVFHISLHDSIPRIRGLQSQITSAGLSADGTNVRVCIIDTGIDSDHVMFTGRIDTAAGYDFANNDANPEDDNGHGSHVAGIAAGRTGLTVNFGCAGSEPFQGVAPNVSLIAVKVCSASGSCATSNIVAGLNRCASTTLPGGPADVINMSLGGGQFSGTCDTDATALAANNAVAAGVVVVAAAGNNGFANALSSPACGSQVIAVGATYDDPFPNCEFPTQNSFSFCTASFFGQCVQTCTNSAPAADSLACFSNRNANLDVTAPGCIVYSADEAPGGETIAGLCGTSMAAPHVAGLAALIRGADPGLTPAEVHQLIREGAVDLGAPGFDPAYGHGRIDVINSLMLIAPGCGEDSECDDELFCNGVEFCDAGVCQDGNAPCSGQLCREADDTCVDCLTDADCSDGLFCTGAEVCSPAGVCMAAAPPNCDDSVECTIDACNESADQCDHAPDHGTCDDGLFCNGTETCHPVNGCTAGGSPCGAGDCDEDADDCLSGPVLWLAFRDSALVPGVGTVQSQDIVAYDVSANTWSLVFDGSDVGLTGLAIDGMAVLPSGDILLSFTNPAVLSTMTGGPAGSTTLADADIVRFIPTALGAATSGSLVFYFDGSDVGLTLSSEDIDAISLTSDGRLVLSTTGNVVANGASGADTDLLVFNATSLGEATAGTFELYFDGSDVALSDSTGEDIDAAALTPSGTLLLSTNSAVAVPGVSAANEDIFEFAPTSLGVNTAGVYTLLLDLTALGIHTSEDITALEFSNY